MKIKQLPLLILFLLSFLQASTQSLSSFNFGVLQYNGGGDWYSNPTSVPNLAEFCRTNLNMNIGETEFVDVGSPDIYNFPFVHMTGHGNVVFSASQTENLRNYLLGGGFLHIDDNYGMDQFIRPQLKKVFPEYDLVEVPFSHPIYHQKYDFPNGLPKIHEHDGKSPQGFGIFHEGRLILFYTYECDLGDGWEDQAVHKDSQEARLKALKMGANIVQYALLGEDEIFTP